MTLQLEIEADGLSARGLEAFDLDNTVDCGQAFRWWRFGGSYHGVVKGRLLVVQWSDGSLNVSDYSSRRRDPLELVDLVTDYFGLGDDHAARERVLRATDSTVAEAIEFAPGIRILAQDPWECLVSFIVSARNYIPSIMSTIARLCRSFGERVSNDDYENTFGTRCYAFPTAGALSRASVADIENCGAAFRARYISNLARLVVSGQVDLCAISRKPYVEAKESLMSLFGVGPKIAECVLLYSMRRYEAFPIDVWISRVMRFVYLEDPQASLARMQEFARHRFGNLAGFAQQYLFYWARSCKADYLRKLDRNSSRQ